MIKQSQQRYWLYKTGLLETLAFYNKQKLYWFITLDNNRFVYSNYVRTRNPLDFKRYAGPT